MICEYYAFLEHLTPASIICIGVGTMGRGAGGMPHFSATFASLILLKKNAANASARSEEHKTALIFSYGVGFPTK